MKSSANHSALQAYQLHYCYKTAALSCGFYFYSLNTFSLKPKRNLPIPLHCSPLSAEKAVSMNTKATGGHGIGSPCKPPSRVQRVRSAIRDDGAAAVGTGMCRLRRSVRPVGREEGPAKRAVCRGRRLLVTFGLSKVTRQAAQRRRNPVEGSALASYMTKPCH